MKIQLIAPWKDGSFTFNPGTIVDVSDVDGEKLISLGHKKVHPDTPSRINPELYDVGCVPTPFSPQTSETFNQASKHASKKK